jgi:hypothetical protein
MFRQVGETQIYVEFNEETMVPYLLTKATMEQPFEGKG